MSAHGSLHHRRAARALVRRKPTNVQVLEERFSPTAIFPGMTDPQDFPDPLTVLFPDGPRHGHGHHETTEILEPPVISTPSPTAITPTTSIPIVTPIPVTTSTTSTPIVVVAPTTSSSVVLTTRPITSSSSVQPTTVVVPVAASRSLSSTIPSPSASAASSSSGVSVGAVVGGVGAGIVAIAAVGFAVAYFIRRIRKRKMDEAAGFDASEFRRSAIILNDPPTHEDTVARGYNPPPPPSMMEKHQHDPASAPAWGYPQSLYTENTAGHGAYNQYQYQAQHYPSMPSAQTFNSASPPVTATSAQPFITANNAPYGQNPFSPVASISSPYEQSVVAPVLTRQTSNNSVQQQYATESPEMIRQAAVAPYPTLTRQPSTRSANIPVDDYVDLDRASVSPYQAVQYMEISRRLNVEPPPLPTAGAVPASPDSASPAQLYATQQKDLPPVPPPLTLNGPAPFVSPAVSPFADPEPSTPVAQSAPATPKDVLIQLESVPAPEPVPAPAPVVVPTPPPAAAKIEVLRSATPPPQTPSTLSVQTLHFPASSVDSASHEELEFPIPPPSPAISYSSRYRVDSLPPTLPEIHVQERSSVSSYIPRSPMIGTGYISGMTDISGTSSLGLQPFSARPDGKFVPVPSPLASSFGVATPHREPEGEFSQAQEKVLKEGTVTATASAAVAKGAQSAGSSIADSKGTNDKRPNTVYDPEDAYGGI